MPGTLHLCTAPGGLAGALRHPRKSRKTGTRGSPRPCTRRDPDPNTAFLPRSCWGEALSPRVVREYLAFAVVWRRGAVVRPSPLALTEQASRPAAPSAVLFNPRGPPPRARRRCRATLVGFIPRTKAVVS